MTSNDGRVVVVESGLHQNKSSYREPKRENLNGVTARRSVSIHTPHFETVPLSDRCLYVPPSSLVPGGGSKNHVIIHTSTARGIKDERYLSFRQASAS
mmetsp:Transcript_9056/g.20457  ORF Transcript_9056/g.20457 Transcript_9056/m.20457 type:complete len:98 (+) Transcript_9056:797-1090(+)